MPTCLVFLEFSHGNKSIGKSNVAPILPRAQLIILCVKKIILFSRNIFHFSKVECIFLEHDISLNFLYFSKMTKNNYFKPVPLHYYKH